MRPFNPGVIPAALALAFCFLSGSAAAQQDADSDPVFPLSIGVQVGHGIGGAAPGLAAAYIAAGYGDRSPGGCFLGTCFNGIKHPTNRRVDRLEITLRLRLRVHSRWAIALAGGTGPAGVVEGFDAEWVLNGRDGAESAVHYGARWTGATVEYRRKRLRLALGPAVERASWTVDYYGDPGKPTPEAVRRPTTLRPGYMAEAALTVASFHPVRAELVLRYRDGGRVRLTDLHGNVLTVHSRTLFIGLGIATR